MVFYSINYPKNIEKESPLISICFNIFIPVLILKNGDNWIHKILDLFDISVLPLQLKGEINLSSITFLIALIFPVAYFIYDLLKRKNVNIISILGFINVLLTGGIGIFGERFGLSKNWFIIKEGALPSLIGLALITLRKIRKESFNNILLNDMLFDNYKISSSINYERQNEFERIVYKAGSHFIMGLFISSFLQFVLASIIVTADPGEPLFTEQVATMTWVSFLAVFVITLSIVGKGYLGLISGIEKITGLKREDFLKT
ncbi:MAG: VC0807 family protein [Candidatus Neomarinimicrobiota bacterium]